MFIRKSDLMNDITVDDVVILSKLIIEKKTPCKLTREI